MSILAISVFSVIALRGECDATLAEGWRFAKDPSCKADWSAEALDDSALTSTRRDIGSYGGFGFGGANPEPIESAALAIYALKTTKRDPTRRMRLL